MRLPRFRLRLRTLMVAVVAAAVAFAVMRQRPRRHQCIDRLPILDPIPGEPIPKPKTG